MIIKLFYYIIFKIFVLVEGFMLNTNIYDYLEICQKEINKLGQNLNYSTPHLEIINTMEEIYKHIKNVCTRFNERNG